MCDSQLIRFSLRLWGEQLKPQLVTDALGFEPSYSYEKGYRKQLSSGKTAAPKELGIWVFERVVEFSFENELNSLLKILEGKNLKEIDSVQIVILDLYLGLSNNNSVLAKSYECRLDNNVLTQLGDLGLDLRITVN